MSRRRCISAKVDDDVIAALDDLKPLYPGADGADASRSSVIRGLLADGLGHLPTDAHEGVRGIAARLGVSRAEAWRRVVAAGIDALADGKA